MYKPFAIPTTEPETKPANPFTLEALAAWIATKPADKEYCWESFGQCLIAQYGQFLSLPVSKVKTPYNVSLDGFTDHGGTDFASDVAFKIAAPHPRTFGWALLRCRAEIARRGASQ